MKTKALVPLVFAVSIFCSNTRADLIGLDILEGGTPSTCMILSLKDKMHICMGTLVAQNRILTNLHCLKGTPMLEDYEIDCAWQSHNRYSERARANGKIWIAKHLLADPTLEKTKYLRIDDLINTTQLKEQDDQLEIELDRSLPKEMITPIASASDLQQFTKEDSTNPSAKYECYAESMGFDEKSNFGDLHSAKVRNQFMVKDSELGTITVGYRVNLNTPEEVKLVKKMDSTFANVLELIEAEKKLQAFPLLALAGDSGSPLYCYDKVLGESSQKLFGLLKGGFGDRDSTQKPTYLELGLRWITLQPMEERKMYEFTR